MTTPSDQGEIYRKLLDHYITEAKEDEVGLWYIVSDVRRDLEVSDPPEVRRITMELVRDLLKAGIRAGYYDSPFPFKAWPLTDDEVIERINREWDALEQEPDIADIVIFVD